VPKKLIVCADGTWSDEDRASARTNVAKIHRALQTWAVEGVDQWVCYVSGVGTTSGEALCGGAFGYGLTRNILQGYYFLIDNYQPGDQLYFFGFSRGAYTVRSLAGFIRNSGLLKLEYKDHVDQAFKLYRSRSSNTNPNEREAVEFRHNYSYEPEIVFIGVWDTVGSLGIPNGSLRLLSLLLRLFGYDWQFHDVKLSRHVRYAYQALSIHERRSTFVPTLWEKQDGADRQVLEQVWFPGTHCDVGGGYNAAGLSDGALYWMIEKAKECGLLFRKDTEQFGFTLAPDPFSRLHNSDSIWFRIIDVILRRRRGGPRVYSAARKYCAGISSSAKVLWTYNSEQEWPESFRKALKNMPPGEVVPVLPRPPEVPQSAS